MASRYLVYGLCLESELVLPELVAVSEGDVRPVDVTIAWEQPAFASAASQRDTTFRLEADFATLTWQNTAQFTIRQGREILIRPDEGASEALLRPFLLGQVLAALLHQRGELVLHASSVAFCALHGPLRAVAFLGQSQSGKSTMASAFHEQGHLSLSDDVTSVPLDNLPIGEKPLVHAGLPHLKLRAPTVEALGKSLNSLQLWHPSHDGYLMRLPDTSSDWQLPAALNSLYLLQEGPLNIEKMMPAESLMALANNSFYVRLLRAEGRARNFLHCAQLVERVPVFRLQRPRDLTLLSEVVAVVEEHQNKIGG